MNHSNFLLRQGGFSLVELLVAVTVLALLSAVCVPSIAAWTERSRMVSLSEDLLVHLYLARSEAIKRGGRVALCKSADGETCARNGSWEQGWIIFHDADNDGLRDPGEPIMQRMAGLPAGWRLVGNSTVARYISYHPTGTTRVLSGAFQAGTLTLCKASNGPVAARQIVLNAAGRPKLQATTVANCA